MKHGRICGLFRLLSVPWRCPFPLTTKGRQRGETQVAGHRQQDKGDLLRKNWGPLAVHCLGKKAMTDQQFTWNSYMLAAWRPSITKVEGDSAGTTISRMGPSPGHEPDLKGIQHHQICWKYHAISDISQYRIHLQVLTSQSYTTNLIYNENSEGFGRNKKHQKNNCSPWPVPFPPGGSRHSTFATTCVGMAKAAAKAASESMPESHLDIQNIQLILIGFISYYWQKPCDHHHIYNLYWWYQ